MELKTEASIEDLYHVTEEGKAELVNGEIVFMSPTGARPGRAAGRVFASLLDHEDQYGGGHAFGDNVGFIVDLPLRKSFSPDAAWYDGDIDRMGFVTGAPELAVEIRSENDYGLRAERELAKKRGDYFAAGTQVVWDVDLQNDDAVKVYRATDPIQPTVYRRGDSAEAEPAVPGWRMPVDDLFR